MPSSSKKQHQSPVMSSKVISFLFWDKDKTKNRYIQLIGCIISEPIAFIFFFSNFGGENSFAVSELCHSGNYSGLLQSAMARR